MRLKWTSEGQEGFLDFCKECWDAHFSEGIKSWDIALAVDFGLYDDQIDLNLPDGYDHKPYKDLSYKCQFCEKDLTDSD